MIDNLYAQCEMSLAKSIPPNRLYTILFYQQLQRASPRREIGSEDSAIILEAASTITRVVEDAMIYWDVQYFPMIWQVCYSAVSRDMC